MSSAVLSGPGVSREHKPSLPVQRPLAIMDGNEAAASVAYRLSQAIAIYPITPSTPMGESCDEWAATAKPNIWGEVPGVVEMQSEAGVAGALHGMLQAGCLSTSFTASQGLLLMIPAMYKMAGELTPFCLHVAARAVATSGLSIFGDHSDVMAVRPTGFAMLCSSNVQESHDMACISHAATLETRLPFLHFFDGFRTSHEINQLEILSDDDLKAMLDTKALADFYARGLSPERPVIRGTAQNPDVFFQTRERVNSYYLEAPERVRQVMDRFAGLTGRSYHLVDYVGDPRATEVVVVMGSAAETVIETSRKLNIDGRRTGVLVVRLYRPFPVETFLQVLPSSVVNIAVLDRTKEPGSVGEPLFQDVVTSLACRQAARTAILPRVIGGRYGLGSKEFTPAMAKAVFDEMLQAMPRHSFTVGIMDDVTGMSLDVEEGFQVDDPETINAVFYGLGSDGTVGANKNTIKIIGMETGLRAQGYFVYDSKKSGAVTISHLRFGPRAIRAPYVIAKGTARFVACHQWDLLEKNEVLAHAAPGAVCLINSPYPADRIWEQFSRESQKLIVDRGLKLYTIDAYRVARESGMGGRINTVMQTCFFAVSGVLPREEAIAQIKKAIQKSYARKGEAMVKKNFDAVDRTLENLQELRHEGKIDSIHGRPMLIPPDADAFIHQVTGVMMAGRGDELPVSVLPADGTWPLNTSRWEKRNLAADVPLWDPVLCIQCNKCALVCPHASLRAKFYPESELAKAPQGFKSAPFRSREHDGHRYTLQLAAEDCTGCGLCIEVCPAKDKTNPKRKALSPVPQSELRWQEKLNFSYFLKLPNVDRTLLKTDEVKASQFLEPLFEFSGACAGCGETPYIKLVSQLFGDRALIANATGCSSIYGGNLPTTPYSTNAQGRGPAWANSLFEDNAEFGLGMRFALDRKEERIRSLIKTWSSTLGAGLVDSLLQADQSTEKGIAAQRERVVELLRCCSTLPTEVREQIHCFSDALVKKSVWIIGGDGWAYDIGYGGLDHVLSLGLKVNILVLDTEVYSNTGGQASKSTPLGAVAKFAVNGKAKGKKDLGMIAMTYGDVYVARIAFGAKDSQTVKVLNEAEAYPGTSLIIAYSHCIAHGYGMQHGLEQQKLAVDSGYWPLYRFDPRRTAQGLSPLQLDSGDATVPLGRYTENEARFRILEQSDPERFLELHGQASARIKARQQLYRQLADLQMNTVAAKEAS